MVWLCVSTAWAEDPSFAGTQAPAPEVEELQRRLVAELGGSFASGNAVFVILNGSATGDVQWKQNKFSGAGAVAWGRAVPDTNADGHVDEAERDAGFVENARRVGLDLRYDRFFGERDSLYALVGAVIDPFAGYDLRTHEQLGYSHVFTPSDTTKLTAEVGFDVAQENYVDGVVPGSADILAARAMVGLLHCFSEHVSFEDRVEAYENILDVEDLRALNTASLTSTLAGRLSIKLSHTLTYDNVPVEGFLSLDHTGLLTLVVTVL
jgi:putative salt-induced outer membrane protein YdiY